MLSDVWTPLYVWNRYSWNGFKDLRSSFFYPTWSFICFFLSLIRLSSSCMADTPHNLRQIISWTKNVLFNKEECISINVLKVFVRKSLFNQFMQLNNLCKVSWVLMFCKVSQQGLKEFTLSGFFFGVRRAHFRPCCYTKILTSGHFSQLHVWPCHTTPTHITARSIMFYYLCTVITHPMSRQSMYEL